ncbi:MAG: hypothetical protein WAK94_05185 [Steroidobacteraceae bacterium]|jgi:hypothetical protein
MTLVEFLGTPEWRYVGLPIAATALTVLITAVSRPRGHKRPVFADFKVGQGWTITAILLWAFDAATVQSTHSVAKWSWWTPVALVVLLAVSTAYVVEYGWKRQSDDTLKVPLEFGGWGMIVSLVLGALSLLVLYIQMRGPA